MVQCASKNSKQENKQECVGKEVLCCEEKEAAAPEAALNAECTTQQANNLEALMQHQTRQLLEGALGKENLSDTVMWFEEGTVKKEVTYVFKDTEDELRFTWEENGPTISWSNTKARWSFAGIRCGTTLKELNALNGIPLHFYGFNWDYGGTVKLNKGKISKLGLELILAPATECPGAEMLSGDAEFNSADLDDEVLTHLYVREIRIVPSDDAIPSDCERPCSSSRVNAISRLSSLLLKGTEPFWSLHFDETYMRFTPGINEAVRLIKYVNVDETGGALTVKGLYEENTYTIKIVEEKCNDGLSDKTYEYSAHITCGNGQIWTGCGKLSTLGLKTNYHDLPESEGQKLKTMLGTAHLTTLDSEAFQELWAYLNKTVIQNNSECPLGGPYGTDPATAYFWFIYNSLPGFVDEQERHRGYYRGQSKQSPLNKLMAYAIYRIDRSPKNLESIFAYVKPSLKRMVSTEVYESKFKSKVTGLIQSYDQLTKTNNYKAIFTQTYQLLDTINGRIHLNYETGKEEYSAELGAYGFSKYDIENYLMRRLQIGEENQHHWDVTHLTFWMRRWGEGNMHAVYDILVQIKKIYESKK